MSGNANSYPPTSTKETLNSADSFDGQSRPEHHLHRESEPLPGSDSVASSQDQSKDSLRENRQDTGTLPTLLATRPPIHFDATFELIMGIRLLGVTGIRQRTPDFEDSSFGQNALNSERPLNVEPANQGGVAIDEREGLPEGHANVADKMIGKVQKVIYPHSSLAHVGI